MAPSSSFFNLHRSVPELIAPAKPTPRELKHLSEIDQQQGLRYHILGIQFYKRKEGKQGIDPVKVIKGALAKTLVSYYPFAGRLIEGPDKKLIVDCTAEGALFIEANADVTLEMFGALRHAPIPGVDELLHDVSRSSPLLNSPLMSIQVTRLVCGGFIVGVSASHVITDGCGVGVFMQSLAETARGATFPSVEPVWRRELLSAREPPMVTSTHREYDQVPGTLASPDEMVERAFYFGPKEASALRNQLPPHLQKSSIFEIVTACLWRCRTSALNVEPDMEMRLMLAVNARSKFNPPLPVGYYGNAVAFPAAVSAAGQLCCSPLEYALQLVREAKAQVTEEYVKSMVDLLALEGRPRFAVVGTFLVSDLTRTGLDGVDFGWGKAVYSGPAKPGVDYMPGVMSFYIPSRNKNGVNNGIVVPISLPGPAMDRFVVELKRTLNASSRGSSSSGFTVSAL